MKMYKQTGVLGVGIMLAIGLAGCGPAEDTTAQVPPPDTIEPTAEITPVDNNIVTDNATSAEGKVAVAILKPTQGNNISGKVTFTQKADGVLVEADIVDLEPGKHGFHIHEKGDCSAPDATSAGGHFNPTNMPHGAPADEKRHSGDFGNIVAGSDGKAHFSHLDKTITMDGPNTIIGRAVIVHKGEDDLKSQPSGDAGDRGACGVIDAETA